MPARDQRRASGRASRAGSLPKGGAARRRRTQQVLVTDHAGRGLASGGLGAWLERIAPAAARGVVTVAVVSDARIRTLNSTYRGVDKATDVLSFPVAEPASRGPIGNTGPLWLGDIVIARGVARRQARDARHGERTEWRLLALHGLLHLLGYDHERDHGEMRRLERRLRRKGGLKEGLIDRACFPS
jgi:probable rRNA maturation factor